MILADFIATACCASQHLLKQDTRFYAAHKYQRSNLRHINTCRQQIDSDDNAGEAFILEAFDFLLNFFLIAISYAAGNLHNRITVQLLVGI